MRVRRSVVGLAVVFLVAAAGALWLLQERRGAGSVSTVEEGDEELLPAVEEVVISVDGDAEQALQP